MSNAKSKKKMIGIISAIIVMISSLLIYNSVIQPRKYAEYMDLGNKYLLEGRYDEAVLAFEKAIKIDKKSTEARVGAAKGYIGIKDIDSAVEKLEEAQELDIKNEKLLKKILEILNEVDPDIAYELLDRFIEVIGLENASSEIQEILNTANEKPSEPGANPMPGTYVKPISVKLKLDKLKVGHSYYYTLNGTSPNKGSEKYRGQIEINETTTIKLVGYNKNDESTDVITLEYIIDEDIVQEIKNILKESEELLKNTSVGTDIGQTTQESKKEFELAIKNVKNKLKEDLQSYKEAENIKAKISKALETFKENIIEPTDKSQLKKQINTAQSLYDNSAEGNEDGQYKTGSKSTLLKEIKDAQKIYDDVAVSQNKVDTQVSKLKNAISIFEKNKVKLGKKVLTSSEINKYKQRIYSALGINPGDRRIEYDYDIAQYSYPNIHNKYHTFCIFDDDGVMWAQILVIDIATDQIYMCDESGRVYNI